MFEQLGFSEITPIQASVWFGILIGVAFGILAEISRFCLRRGLVGPTAERAQALGVWLTALATAIIGTQLAVSLGWISFEGHRFLSTELPWLAILVGGLSFGAGMVLTRGCVSRLTVLGGSGNLRALTVLIVFAIAAHATLKGVLSPIRTTLGAYTIDAGDASALSGLAGGATLWTGLIVSALLVAIWRARPGLRQLVTAILIGALVPLAWVGTGFVLLDEFDPIAMESLSFTSPASETLFWTIAGTAVPAGFGTGLFGGVLAGALVSSLLAGRFAWQSFSSPRETGRYLLGAFLMGVGGVLAGGCTLGAGLSGVATLSVAAILALVAIVLGALVTNRVVSAQPHAVSDAPLPTQPLQPAE
jgi:uncharacterized membrane protein YedE/YeeE